MRVNRVAIGLFGDSKSVGGGVWELRIDCGPGFRIYYGLASGVVVLLLLGGDKASQRADIQKAQEYWNEYRGAQT